jgi:hypothetical protein
MGSVDDEPTSAMLAPQSDRRSVGKSRATNLIIEDCEDRYELKQYVKKIDHVTQKTAPCNICCRAFIVARF